MKKKKLIYEAEVMKKKFYFLLDYGFIFTFQKNSYIVVDIKYKKNNLMIVPWYDFREHIFEVDIWDLSNKMVLLPYANILNTEIGGIENRKKLKDSLNYIYELKKKHTHGMPKEYFEAIAELYANYVKNNIDEILQWRMT